MASYMIEGVKKGCDLCGSSNASFFIESKGVGFTYTRLFRLVKCRFCGLIYLAGGPTAAESGSLDFKEYYGDPVTLHSRIFDFIMNIFMFMRAKKIEKIKPGGAILDAGCGNGRFLKNMNSRGWKCYGIDISAHDVEIAGAEPGIKVFCQDMNDIELPEKFFDAVTFWHSFEHMREPSRILKMARGLLKDDGILFISVPNIGSFEAKICLRKWFGLELPRHIFQYSPKTLSGLLEKNGFGVVSLNKNSVEYNFPFFAQTFFNAMGGETNYFYNFIRRKKCAQGSNIFLRSYTIFLTVTLLPLAILATIELYFVNIICGNGPVIEIFAAKKGDRGIDG